MNLIQEQVTDHTQNVMRKKERIEMLEALLATHEAIGAEPDSLDVKELKERIRVGRMQLRVMC
jgi:glycerol-3-phosphate cytidylyltransferase-like family protein